MKAIILAAGEGKRFVAFNNEKKPKCLMEIGDTTLLNIQIDTLHRSGIKEIVVVRGYEKDQINTPGIRYYDNTTYKTTNVLYSLFVAEKELNDNVIVLYSDIYYEEGIVRKIMSTTHDISIGCMVNYENIQKLKSDISLEDIELIDFESDNKIHKIGKKLPPVSDHTRGQFIGIFKLSPRGCKQIKNFYEYFKTKSKEASHSNYRMAWITELFSEMMNLGTDISVTIIEHGWFEVNTVEDYQALLKIQSLKESYLLAQTDWKKRAEKYDLLEWVNSDTLLQQMAQNISSINNKTSILDVGTGTGKVLIYLKLNKGDASYQGCDISDAMMKKINPSYGFALKEANVTNLNIFPDSSFDYITARMVFHHIDELHKAMTEIYKKLKEGGKLIICEGNPPSQTSYNFYKEMFFYKETREVFMESDLINLFVQNKYKHVVTQTIILENMSLNNWLDNSGLPQRNIDIIKKMHYNCSDAVKKDYNMKVTKNDILMDWKFSIVTGEK